jgi:hypothetical protein
VPPHSVSPAGNILTSVADPLRLKELLWPDVSFYRQQRDIIYSVWYDDETIVPAGHMLGKDFVAGFIVLAFFLTRHPVRVVTTSVDYEQLEGVLWGEIRRFIQTCKYPLEYDRGGPLVINHMHLRKMVNGELDSLSYVVGRQAKKGEGMSGHHIAKSGDGVPRTLFVSDEASGVDELTYEKASEWANRQLIIGNPYGCNNYFKYAVKGNPKTGDKGGDIKRPGGGYTRRIIKIKAEDSPNVRRARAQMAAGMDPTDEIILPGVLPWSDYRKRRKNWDKIKQLVGLDAEFYEGEQNLLYPPLRLNAAERAHLLLQGRPRQPKAIGIDPGEGSANSTWTAVDELGIVEQVSKKTPDTNEIVGFTIEFGEKWKVDPYYWMFDRGGGGKQHADRLRAMGYPVRTIGFGEPVMLDPKRGMVFVDERKENREERYSYKNRRCQMYGILRDLLNPPEGQPIFAIPPEYVELRRQLALMPLMYDGEGRLYLPPKNKREGATTLTLIDIIGCSPDEADSLVVAVYCMWKQEMQPVAGAG